MNILQVHNRHLVEGGEEYVVESERRLLGHQGHHVSTIEVGSDDLATSGVWHRAKVAAAVPWSGSTYRLVRTTIRAQRPDVVHCHNIFPHISPSVYYAARAEGVPVVQSLHNYRLLCLNGMLLRDGAYCSECVGAPPVRGVIHRCYRNSLPGSAVMAITLMIHRMVRTWAGCVDAYLTLSEHSRAQFVLGGLPAGRLIVKPNFVDPDPGIGTHGGDFALYAGRLSSEKGIEFLVRVWEGREPQMPLRIYGDGPLRPMVEEFAARMEGVSYGGAVPRSELLRIMADARLLMVPSLSDGDVPTVLLQALAVGLPVVASEGGALGEALRTGAFGVTAQTGDAAAWRAAVRRVSSGEWGILSRGARAEYLARYSGAVGYASLMAVYEALTSSSRAPDAVGLS